MGMEMDGIGSWCFCLSTHDTATREKFEEWKWGKNLFWCRRERERKRGGRHVGVRAGSYPALLSLPSERSGYMLTKTAKVNVTDFLFSSQGQKTSVVPSPLDQVQCSFRWLIRISIRVGNHLHKWNMGEL